MKRNYLNRSILLLMLIGFSQAYGQTLKTPTLDKAKAIHAGTTASFHQYSPDFHHEHDGEPCLSDALTQDWIERAGITEEYNAQVDAQNEMVRREIGGERSTYTIPVIFHVVYNTTSENVSEADINALFDAVNEDFSASNPDVGDARGVYGFDAIDADIEFCLAKQDESGELLDEYGIHRVSTVETWFNPNTETNKMKGSTGGDTGTEGWDRDRYLNVWICDITNGASSGVAGYAYKPTTSALPPASIDGIVIDYNLGTNPAAHILSHEIGHFLGLDHTWGGSSGSCVSDDGLDDTPNNAGPSFDFSGSCSGSQETCSGIQTQYENFMDYSNCTCMFTADQSNLMHLVLDDSRSELAASDVCESPFALAPIAEFEADITTVIEGGSINFTDLSENLPTTWNWVVTPSTGVSFIDGTSSSTENPVIQYANVGFYTVALTVTNGEGTDTETKSSYIEVVIGGGGASACDTIRNYTDAEYDNAAYYNVTGESGYYPAQLTLDDGALLVFAYAEKFYASSPTFVKRLRMPIYQADDIGGASNVAFHVFDDAGGEPGAIVATEIVAISDMNAGFFNIVEFSAGVAVSGNYWVGVEFDYTYGFDTLVFGTTNFADRPSGPSSTSVFISDGIGWTLTSDVFGSSPDCSLILEVLTSNGPSPVAVVSFPEDETCEGMEVTMNGFGSLNTTSYYWDITDGTDLYFFAEPNLTTSFEEGTWTISLIVDGACESDESEDFVLTVNPPMNVSTSTEDENCSAADGEISFTVTGGDGGAYNYSITDGDSFFSSSTFSGLTSATYNYVITDNANCEESGTVNVGNENTFDPTISPDIIIEPGTSTDLTVTGGVTWAWYEGSSFIASTATITVTPDVTTTYICNVTDAEGCETTKEVTVTIDDGSGIEGVSLGKSLSIFPNPTKGDFYIKFNLNDAKDIQMNIVNVLGDNVISENFKSIKNNTIKMDMNSVAPGIYFVVIQSADETVTKKIIVRR